VIWAIIAPGRGRAAQSLFGRCHIKERTMNNRGTGTQITFRRPFTIAGLDGIQPLVNP
jgi:hypothetical protein